MAQDNEISGKRASDSDVESLAGDRNVNPAGKGEAGR